MDIYSILSSKPHNVHYLNRYIKFISACQAKNVDYVGYTEKHHICPKAKDMFPEYKDFNKVNTWNKAILTARQHFIAHIMLWKIFPNIQSCTFALWQLKCTGKIYMNSKIYNNLRISATKKISLLNKNKILSEETKNKISLANKGKEKSQEFKNNLSLSRKGVKLSEQNKTGISNSLKGKKKTKEHIDKIANSIKDKSSLKGKNNPKHKYNYFTPQGIFYSPTALKHLNISRNNLYKWCITSSDEIISLQSFYKNRYLISMYTETEIIGKTYRDLGFYHTLKSVHSL